MNNKGYHSAGTIYLQPLPWNPAVFFRRCQIIAGGVVTEGISDFNRLNLMLHALRSEEEQIGIAAEGFCSFDDKHANVATDTRHSYRLENHVQS